MSQFTYWERRILAMSAKITVKNSILLDSQKNISTLSRKLSEIDSSLTSIKNSLNPEIKSRQNIKNIFEDICEQVNIHKTRLTNVSNFLSDTVKNYKNAEKKIVNNFSSSNEKEPRTVLGIFSYILNMIKSINISLKSIMESLSKAGILVTIPELITAFLDVIKEFNENGGYKLGNNQDEPIAPEIPINIPPLSGVLSFNPNEFSEDVLLLQKRLNELGYTDANGQPLIENGYFDKSTLEAVNKYKDENYLLNIGRHAGKVGIMTWIHLFSNPKVPYTPPSNMDNNLQNVTDALLPYIDEYVNFTINGQNVKIPYYITPQGTNLYGGKRTPAEIREFILNNASGPSDYQRVANEYARYTGVDCSGFVAYVLNEATGGKLLEVWGTTYANGIKASNLTSTQYGEQITQAKDVVPGSTISTANGTHVIVVYEVVKTNGVVTEIKYAHSNGSKGPHLGSITIGDENQDLDGPAQTWNDIAYTDAQAKGYYDHTILLDCVRDTFPELQ